jgi:hypothetical protein
MRDSRCQPKSFRKALLTEPGDTCFLFCSAAITQFLVIRRNRKPRRRDAAASWADRAGRVQGPLFGASGRLAVMTCLEQDGGASIGLHRATAPPGRLTEYPVHCDGSEAG